ncbi:spore germination protein xc. bacillus [Halalkalibacter akibai JCM 9157]|uniref:Spore germination protein xc. bacillus n=2 Tax=Halalkalibacter akibai TaxID=1411 RepID=W4QYF9_HALA3|nr:spore germination protein xc. bacillus [Halalkalibacter akibai JCM 9157]
MDYEEEKEEYTVYLQGINFANVAKLEGGKPTEDIPNFVAHASAETLNLAVRELYKVSEPPLYFGHVSTLVLSQPLVENKSREVLEEIGRNRSLRPTLHVVTTEEDIEEIFNMEALFNYPAIYTVLFREKKGGLAQDELVPTSLMNFLRVYYEPMGVAKIPSVKIDQDSWIADKKFPVLYFNGYSAFQQQQFIKNLPLQQSVYLNWLVERKISINQRVEENGELLAVVKLAKPKVKIKYDKDTSMPIGTMEISTSVELLEKLSDIPVEKLRKLVEEDIKANVEAIYMEGISSNLDLLNVGENWFRQHPKQFRKLMDSEEFYLDKEALKEVKVDVQILHYNTYQYDLKG